MVQQLIHIIIISIICIIWGLPSYLFLKKSSSEEYLYGKGASTLVFLFFSGLLSLAVLSSWVFSYTHFMVPHDPYQVDENGNVIPFAKPGGQDMNGYLKQLKYSNKLIREITQQLLKDSSRKKIIIIQGDHGYRHYTNAPETEPYGALNAIYFYNKDYAGLYKKISLVNTYRVVLNVFFGCQIPLLKDSIVGAKMDLIN
jgi:Sulfatase